MNVQIDFASPVVSEARTNIFELIVGHTHGDADGDTEEEFYFELSALEELKRDLAALEAVESFDGCEDQVAEIFKKMGVPEADIDELVEAFLDDYYVGDHTNDGSTAAGYTGYELFWYDNEGVKHDTKVTVTE